MYQMIDFSSRAGTTPSSISTDVRDLNFQVRNGLFIRVPIIAEIVVDITWKYSYVLRIYAIEILLKAARIS